MKDSKWDFWQFLFTQKDRWVKSISNGSNIFLKEISFKERLIKDLISLKQLSISWICNIKPFITYQSSISINSALKIFIKIFTQISVSKNSLLDGIHLDINSIQTHFKVDQLWLLTNISFQWSIKILKIFIPLIHEVISKLRCWVQIECFLSS